MSDLVERVAKAMAEQKLWAGVWEHMPDAERETFRELAFSAIAVVLEEAAKVADGVGQQPPTDNLMHDTGWDGASLVIAAAIRVMIPKET